MLWLQDVDADQACALLCQAIQKSHPSKDDKLLRVLAEACLQHGLQNSSSTQLQLIPVSCCTLGECVKQHNVDMTGKLLANLDSAALAPFFRVMPAPKGVQPSVLPLLAKLIQKKHKSAPIKIVLSKLPTSPVQPQSIAGLSDGNILVSSSKQAQAQAPAAHSQHAAQVKTGKIPLAGKHASAAMSDQQLLRQVCGLF